MIEIINWQKHFENDQSRRCKEARYFVCPNNTGKPKLLKLLKKKNGLEIFGGFVLLCELASQPKCPDLKAENRGFINEDFETISAVLGKTEQETKSIIGALSELGWLVVHTECIPSADGIQTDTRARAEGKERRKEGKKERREGKEGKKGKNKTLLPSPLPLCVSVSRSKSKGKNETEAQRQLREARERNLIP